MSHLVVQLFGSGTMTTGTQGYNYKQNRPKANYFVLFHQR